MLIGPHCSKFQDVNEQRNLVRGMEYSVFQTMFGGTQSYDIPVGMLKEYRDKQITPYWIWHVAYTASVNPGERSREGCAEYLRNVIRCAHRMNVTVIVVHIGTVSGKTCESVMSGIDDFLINYGVLGRLNEGETRLAIEISACTCGISLHPDILASAYKGSKVGWCLDLAHTHAAGLSWIKLRYIIEEYPPIVVHSNFPGSDFGSSRDIHGWRTHPKLQKEGRNMIDRSPTVVEELVEHYDNTIRLLASKEIPMIVEGSGFSGGGVMSEIEYLRSIYVR